MNGVDDVLHKRYVTTQLGRHRSVTADQLESYARHYSRVFGPLLPQDRSAHILEIGFGLGHFLHFLKSEGYRNHWGIDIGPEQVEACRKEISNQVEWAPDTRSYLLRREAAYDVIVLICVMEHISDDDLFPLMDAIKQALTPHGRVMISVPNAACVTSLVTRYGDLTHKRLFTESSLTQLLMAAGFENVRAFPNEKKEIRSFGSRREKLVWGLRERLARWLLSELHRHLMEGSYPLIQTVNILAVGDKGN